MPVFALLKNPNPWGGWLCLVLSKNDLAGPGLATIILPIPSVDIPLTKLPTKPDNPIMCTHSHNEPNTDAQRRLAEKSSLGKTNRVYFKFLGLTKAESCEEAILSAAKRMAALVQEREAFNPPEVITRSRHEIALATYRLLDPRRRQSQWERIQLTRPLDRQDRQYQSPEPGSLLRCIEQASDHPMQEPLLEPLIDRAMNESAGQSMTVDAKSDSRSWLEERREIVRSLRGDAAQQSDSVKRWDKYGLNWLRAVFGL